MISLTIKDIKVFMSHLLIKETFDNLLLSEASIATSATYNIDGSINKGFYSEDELAALPDINYTLWQNIKPFCFSLIKGNKVPTGMKLVFLLSKPEIDTLLSNAASDGESVLSADDINGLFLNITYSNGVANIITGTSLKVFTMDKTTERAFDKYVKIFLENAGINFEEA